MTIARRLGVDAGCRPWQGEEAAVNLLIKESQRGLRVTVLYLHRMGYNQCNRGKQGRLRKGYLSMCMPGKRHLRSPAPTKKK